MMTFRNKVSILLPSSQAGCPAGKVLQSGPRQWCIIVCTAAAHRPADVLTHDTINCFSRDANSCGFGGSSATRRTAQPSVLQPCREQYLPRRRGYVFPTMRPCL